MAALKERSVSKILERSQAEARIARGEIATLLSEIEAGVYVREQAIKIVNEVVGSKRSPSFFGEIRTYLASGKHSLKR